MLALATDLSNVELMLESIVSSVVVISHIWLLSIGNVARMTGK